MRKRVSKGWRRLWMATGVVGGIGNVAGLMYALWRHDESAAMMCGMTAVLVINTSIMAYRGEV